MGAFNKGRIFMFFLSLVVVVNSELRHMIESPTITNWGTWGELESCPVGSFVTGVQLKVERSDGWKDDTGLNGIRLFCSKLSSFMQESPSVITSSVGPYGEWKSIFRCGDNNQAVVGFQMKIEQYKGVKDDTSANNLRVFCENLEEQDEGSESKSDEEETPRNLFPLDGDGTPWGEWTDEQLCRSGYAICGIVTQVDHGHGEGKGYDDTALNNVKAECCKIRFHDQDFHETLEGPSKLDDIMFPDPLQSARDLQKTLLQMQHNRNINMSYISPSASQIPDETHPTNDRRAIVTLPEVLRLDQPQDVPPSQDELPRDKPKGDTEQQHNLDRLSKELSLLAALNFGKPEVTTHFTVSSDPDEHSDNSIHSPDELAAQPIVPPEVVQYIESDLKDGDQGDQDTIHIKVIAGAINLTTIVPNSTTVAPSRSTPPPMSNRDDYVHVSEDNQLLVASSGSTYYPYLNPIISFGVYSTILQFTLFAN